MPRLRSIVTPIRSPLAVLGFSALLVPFATAHHGWGGNEEPITLSGTLSEAVSLSGPHATMKLTDENGQEWDITLAPAPRTNRAGLTEEVIPMGAEVTIVGERNQDPELYEVKTRRVSYAGTDYDVYPDR